MNTDSFDPYDHTYWNTETYETGGPSHLSIQKDIKDHIKYDQKPVHIPTDRLPEVF